MAGRIWEARSPRRLPWHPGLLIGSTYLPQEKTLSLITNGGTDRPWHDFQTLGGTFKEGPAAVSWGPNRIDVFVRGMDDHTFGGTAASGVAGRTLEVHLHPGRRSLPGVQTDWTFLPKEQAVSSPINGGTGRPGTTGGPSAEHSRKPRLQCHGDQIASICLFAAWTTILAIFGGMPANGRAGRTSVDRSRLAPLLRRGVRIVSTYSLREPMVS
jgi:hypothetical protein